MSTVLSRISPIFLAASALLLCLPANAQVAKLGEATVSVLIGQKKLSSDVSPVDNQTELGVIADLGRKDSVVNLVASYLYSTDEAASGSTDYKGETWELGLGIRKPFRIQPDIAPFVEAGVAYVDALYENRTSPASGTTSDSAFGIWLGGGVNFAVGEKLVVGVIARHTSASANLLGTERDVGGLHFGITAGMGF